jgi:hypothetical protein
MNALSNDFLLICSLALIGISLLQAGLGFTFGILFARWKNNRAETERWQARRQAWAEGRAFVLPGRENLHTEI